MDWDAADDELPAEAFSSVSDDAPPEIDDEWLAAATGDQQISAMRAWFTRRFCDPAYETPYNGREGGYLFIHGGPYNPSDELGDRFSGVVNDALIATLEDELSSEVGDEWAPIQYGADRFDDYDERYELPTDAPAMPYRLLCEKLGKLRRVAEAAGEPDILPLVASLAFVATISALEAFLFETVDYWVQHDDEVLKRIVTKLDPFKGELMPLGKIFERQAGLRDHVRGHLQTIVWHRWKDVAPLFTKGLEARLPTPGTFSAALEIRHHIVHRGGKDLDGNPVVVDATQVVVLGDSVRTFAADISSQMLAPKATRPGDTNPSDPFSADISAGI